MIAVALVAGLSSTALAQTPSTAQPTTPTAPSTDSVFGGNWFASAYLGSNFGGDAQADLEDVTGVDVDRGSTASVNFGGEIGYAWNNAYGLEFMANYSPNFELENVLLARRPKVSTYMFNGLAAIPLGTEHKFRPFVSGGIGSIQLHSEVFAIDPTTTTADINTIDVNTSNASRFGWDLGGGLMAFNGAWGLRADVRYFKATTNDALADVALVDLFTERQLSGISFWNANFGVAFRW